MKLYWVCCRIDENVASQTHLTKLQQSLARSVLSKKQLLIDLAIQAKPGLYEHQIGICKGNIIKFEADFVIILSDESLTKSQLLTLSKSLLVDKLNIDEVIQDPLLGTDEDQVGHLDKELEETKKIMMANLEKIITRGEHIADIVTKTHSLQTQSHEFHSKAQELNSCWPLACTIL